MQPPDLAVVRVLAGVVEDRAVAVEAFDHPRAHRRLLPEPDRGAQHEDVGGDDGLVEARPVVDVPSVLGHVRPDTGGDLMVDRPDHVDLHPLAPHDLHRDVGEALGVRHLGRALEGAVHEQRPEVAEVPAILRAQRFLLVAQPDHREPLPLTPLRRPRSEEPRPPDRLTSETPQSFHDARHRSARSPSGDPRMSSSRLRLRTPAVQENRRRGSGDERNIPCTPIDGCLRSSTARPTTGDRHGHRHLLRLPRHLRRRQRRQGRLRGGQPLAHRGRTSSTPTTLRSSSTAPTARSRSSPSTRPRPVSVASSAAASAWPPAW